MEGSKTGFSFFPSGSEVVLDLEEEELEGWKKAVIGGTGLSNSFLLFLPENNALSLTILAEGGVLFDGLRLGTKAFSDVACSSLLEAGSGGGVTEEELLEELLDVLEELAPSVDCL